MEQYLTHSPVLFIIYNRYETTLLTFEAIKNAKPPRLYIAADGPKNIESQKICNLTRSIIHLIDWECDVKTLFRNENVGCKIAVSTAIDWFFLNEEMGIILEDDCLPSSDFFRFCDELLLKYQFDNNISIISGCNFQHGKKWGKNSYYFSNLTHIWGWASWRRVWDSYDVNLKNHEIQFAEKILKNIFHDNRIVKKWLIIFKDLKIKKIDTWDYQFAFLNFFNNRLSIIPNVNLIKNIGFDGNATHTFSLNRNANIPHEKLFNISHPNERKVQKDADFKTLFFEFGLKEKKIVRVFKKIKKTIDRFLKKILS